MEIKYSQFYCFNCGEKLIDVGLGIVYCNKCESVFLPYIHNKTENQILEQIKESK